MLTTEQQAVVESTGSIAVSAGAGSGKTKTLAERYSFHVIEQNVSPMAVVALTFTEKAAREMRSRIRQTLTQKLGGQAVGRLAELDASQISTFHAMCARICREHPSAAGVPSEFRIIDPREAPLWEADLLRSALGKLPDNLFDIFDYTRLGDLLSILFKDPIGSDQAFGIDDSQWESWIETARKHAFEKLQREGPWQAYRDFVVREAGEANDKLEVSRRALVRVIQQLEAGELRDTFDADLKAVNLSGGKQAAWPTCDLADMKNAVKALRDLIKEYASREHLTLTLGPVDEQFNAERQLLQQAFASVRGYLREAKFAQGTLSFNDLEEGALKALRDDVSVREYYHERWQVFLIDEFQDTNPVQAEILTYLSQGRVLTVVGDDQQAIYGFRRADTACFSDFKRRISERGGQQQALTLSFRAYERLTAKINGIFKALLMPAFQPLSASRSAPHTASDEPIQLFLPEASAEAPNVKLLKAQRQTYEAQAIASEIERLLQSGRQVYDKRTQETRALRPDDIAVLTRNWSPLDTYMQALESRGLTVLHGGGDDLLGTREAQDAWLMLQFLTHPDHDLSLVGLLRSPFFTLSDRLLQQLASQKPDNKSWWDYLSHTNDLAVGHAVEILASLLSEKGNYTASLLLHRAGEITGYTQLLRYLPRASRRLADWQGMLDLIAELETIAGDTFSVYRRIKRLVDAKARVNRPMIEPSGAISLMTVHAAKGLEWPIVFIADLAKQKPKKWPELLTSNDYGVAVTCLNPDFEVQKPALYHLIQRSQKEKEQAESLRLLYVALTRAEESVYLFSDEDTRDKPETALGTLWPGLDENQIPLHTYPLVYEPGLLTRGEPSRL